MKNDANRWIAAIALLSLFAIIACAGTRSSAARQAPQNVLVTNTSSQPVQVAARPGTGAYIVSVANAPSVKVVSSPTTPVVTKDANNSDSNSAINSGNFQVLASSAQQGTGYISLSSLSVVIDSISLDGEAQIAGESVDSGYVAVFNQSHSFLGSFFFTIPAVQNGNATSDYLGTAHIPVPANGFISVQAIRHGGTTAGTAVTYTIAYHTVPHP